MARESQKLVLIFSENGTKSIPNSTLPTRVELIFVRNDNKLTFFWDFADLYPFHNSGL